MTLDEAVRILAEFEAEGSAIGLDGTLPAIRRVLPVLTAAARLAEVLPVHELFLQHSRAVAASLAGPEAMAQATREGSLLLEEAVSEAQGALTDALRDPRPSAG